MSERQKSKFARAFDITLSVIIALLVVLIVVLLFVATPMTVSGDSMYPSLRDGDKVVVLKVGASIERGDIVVFERPGGNDPPVKRVIGMPGDVIRFDSAQRAYFGARRFDGRRDRRRKGRILRAGRQPRDQQGQPRIRLHQERLDHRQSDPAILTNQ